MYVLGVFVPLTAYKHVPGNWCVVCGTLPALSEGKSEKESLCWPREDLESPSVKLLNLKAEHVNSVLTPEVQRQCITAHKLQG